MVGPESEATGAVRHMSRMFVTDLTYREGGINDEYPFLLGHEAAGRVEAVGPGVTAVEPGDFVVLNWRAVCGECRACKRGRPHLCFDTFNAAQKMTQTDGTELTPEELTGHWTVVFLGFTHCPDICPTTLGQLAAAQKQGYRHLASQAQDLLNSAARPRT